MTEASEDEELQRGIQMSLEPLDSPPNKKRRNGTLEEPEIIDVDECEAPVSSMEGLETDLGYQSAPNGSQPVKPISAFNGILGLDRKAMEQDRLARATSRQLSTQSISPPPTQRSGQTTYKRRKIEPSGSADATQRRPPEVINLETDTPPEARNGKAGKPDIDTKEHAKSGRVASLQYPRGVIKRTWASSHDRANDIKIEEVLQKDQLRRAALSSFLWDHEWLFKKLNLNTIDLLMIVQAKTKADQDQILAEGKAVNPRIKICFPPMPGQVHCMHSKLMLLFYDDYMRIAIPSANLTEYDWGDDGRMENSVFIIDLPGPLESPERTQSVESLSHFGQELYYFLQRMEVPESLYTALLRYDFSQTASLAFIHTTGGSYFGHDKDRTGYPGLSSAVQQLHLQTELPIQLDFAASSLGSLNAEFLRCIYTAAKGYSSPASAPPGDVQVSKGASLQKVFRIYFPTHETVANSFGGTAGAGTICLQPQWYNSSGFPRTLMRDYKSSRPGLLSHNKILFVRGKKAWVYHGSANLSESAWGKVVTDKARKEAKINCRNWECGVLFPVPTDETQTGEVSMDIFKGHVDVPFELPGETYEGRQPWYFMERR